MALCPTNHTLTQGSSLHSPTLGYQKHTPMGFVSLTNPANILCRRSPLLGEGLGVRL